MLAIHWSPVKNTKHILRNGICKSKDGGVFCFPFTGQPNLDKWWANAWRAWGSRMAFNGFVFRIVPDDLPAAFGHWAHGAAEKPMTTLEQIKAEFESAIMFRLGERHFGYDLETSIKHSDDYERVGRELIAKNPQLYIETLKSDPSFLEYIFEDYQIVLSRSIEAKRILHVMSGANDYGRNIVRKKKEKAFCSLRAEVD